MSRALDLRPLGHLPEEARPPGQHGRVGHREGVLREAGSDGGADAFRLKRGGDAGCHGGGPSPVGTHTKGDRVLPTGHIHDLAGNVWEWTLDSYARFATEAQTDPVHLGDGDLTHVVRGGGWNRSHRGIMSWFRGAAIHTYKVPGLGFRCVRNPG